MYNLNEINLTSVMDMLTFLSKNTYSVAWDLIDDFSINGHEVSIKSSDRFNYIIIDHCYEPLNGCKINGMEPLDYVKSILEK